jgi:hypothetical protein
MVKLANPHGQGSWSGMWSNGDAMWEEYPEAAKVCGYKAGGEDNGMFWMQLEHFEKMFAELDVFRVPKEAGGGKFFYETGAGDEEGGEEQVGLWA